MKGPSHCSRSKRRSSQLGKSALIHWLYAPKNVTIGSRGSVMLGTPRSGSLPVRAKDISQRGCVIPSGAKLTISRSVSRSGVRASPVASLR